METKKISTIDEYLKLQTTVNAKMLQELRMFIQKLVPEATEVMSYSMPAFKHNGMLVYFASFKNHNSLFFNPKIILAFKDNLKDFKTSKSSIHFTHEAPFPKKLLKEMILFSAQSNEAKKKKTS